MNLTTYKTGSWRAYKLDPGPENPDGNEWMVATAGDIMCVSDANVTIHTYTDLDHMEKKFQLIAKLPDIIAHLLKIEKLTNEGILPKAVINGLMRDLRAITEE